MDLLGPLFFQSYFQVNVGHKSRVLFAKSAKRKIQNLELVINVGHPRRYIYSLHLTS